MTALLQAGGGPSELHDRRAATLATIATLTGHVLPLAALPDGSIPDALRLRPTDGSLFVGEAKATETPGNVETSRRLDHYARHLTGWVAARGSGVLALAVDECEAYDWLRVLRCLCPRAAHATREHARADLLEVGTAIVWQSFTPARLTTPPPDPCRTTEERRSTREVRFTPPEQQGRGRR